MATGFEGQAYTRTAGVVQLVSAFEIASACPAGRPGWDAHDDRRRRAAAVPVRAPRACGPGASRAATNPALRARLNRYSFFSGRRFNGTAALAAV
jgi:hypothetical protein